MMLVQQHASTSAFRAVSCLEEPDLRLLFREHVMIEDFEGDRVESTPGTNTEPEQRDWPKIHESKT